MSSLFQLLQCVGLAEGWTYFSEMHSFVEGFFILFLVCLEGLHVTWILMNMGAYYIIDFAGRFSKAYGHAQ